VIGAAVTVVVAVVCMSLAYNQEYIDASDVSAIERAVDERIGAIRATEVQALQSANMGNNLFVLFEQVSDESDIVCAVAQFRRGLFGGHCLRSVLHSDWPLYTCGVVEAGFKHYLVVYGIHEPSEAESIRIYPEDLPASMQGEPPRDYAGVEPLYRGSVKAPLLDVVAITREQADSLYHPWFIHYYDADGNQLDSRKLAERFGYDGRTGAGAARSSQGALYLFLAVVLLVAVVIVRYFVRR
jgi:hypothetical protein